MESIRKVHKTKRRKHLFYLWTEGSRERVTRWSFHPKISGGIKSLFSRGECEGTVLQLQHKPGRKPVYIWTEFRRSKGKRTLRPKTNNNKMVRVGLPIKNKILYRIK